jgi:hypothetical protein
MQRVQSNRGPAPVQIKRPKASQQGRLFQLEFCQDGQGLASRTLLPPTFVD